jgi:arylsulfatase A-like enzyme
VIIMADDLGWNDVGYHGSEIRTPNIDRLAAGGVILDRFYAQPTCSPTRAALMTGKAPLRLGIQAPLSKNNPRGLPLTETILPQYLKQAGYQTALVGKWHLGSRDKRYHPNARGFDHFYGNLTGGIGFWDHVHGGGYDLQRNGVTSRDDGYITHLLRDEVKRVIRERDPTRPLFLFASFNAPHLPNEAPPSAIGRYAEIANPYRRTHAAMVSELDAAIGEIVETLQVNGMMDNTIIWFMSDNGGLIPGPPPSGVSPADFMAQLESALNVRMTPRFMEFMRVNTVQGASDNAPLRGGKGTVLEGGTRVPSFLFWNSRFTGRTLDAMVAVQDVTPTLLAASGALPKSAGFDGRSVWNTLLGSVPQEPSDYIVQASRGPASDFALYQYPWKLVLPSGQPAMLFNVAEDPQELIDLAASQPERAAAMKATIDTFPRGANVALPLQEVVDDPDFFGGNEDRAPWADAATQ